MSNSENILAFEAALKANNALREQYEGALQRISENKEASCDGEAMVKAAAEAGYTLTIPEAERFMAEYQTLDDEALSMVAGGDHDGKCVIFWHCFVAFLHTETNRTDVACWSDYECMKISEYTGCHQPSCGGPSY